MKVIRCIDQTGEVVTAAIEADGRARKIEGDLYGDYTITKTVVEVQEQLAPIVPKAILCVGLNYRRHAEETGAELPRYPILFMKSPSSLQDPLKPIVIPQYLKSDKVDYECELAVVIGKATKNVSEDEALYHVFGYTAANDVSARDWQKHAGGGQWCRGKTFDTFCPLVPVLVTHEEIKDPQNLRIRTLINGETFQDSNTKDMIFSVAQLIAFLSGSTTLEPGTVILTGTPAGVGMARVPKRWLVEGDTVSIDIEGIGMLTNPVLNETL